mmetsp:Transcript_2580/g.8630  ORF Transcript_2580/g.8630 Transcript_2580/m.8630 type:complete len:218 (+) Transcript_2580:472-1125(+)
MEWGGSHARKCGELRHRHLQAQPQHRDAAARALARPAVAGRHGPVRRESSGRVQAALRRALWGGSAPWGRQQLPPWCRRRRQRWWRVRRPDCASHDMGRHKPATHGRGGSARRGCCSGAQQPTPRRWWGSLATSARLRRCLGNAASSNGPTVARRCGAGVRGACAGRLAEPGALCRGVPRAGLLQWSARLPATRQLGRAEDGRPAGHGRQPRGAGGD